MEKDLCWCLQHLGMSSKYYIMYMSWVGVTGNEISMEEYIILASDFAKYAW
jgi:hypothetical protein